MRMKHFTTVAAAALVGFAAACSKSSTPTAPVEEVPDQFDVNVGAEFLSSTCTTDNYRLDLGFWINPSLTDAQRLKRALPFTKADSAIVQAQSDSLTARMGRETASVDYTGEDRTKLFEAFERHAKIFQADVEKKTGGLSVQIGDGYYFMPTEPCTNMNAALTRTENASAAKKAPLHPVR